MITDPTPICKKRQKHRSIRIIYLNIEVCVIDL